MSKRKLAWGAIIVVLLIGIAGVCWNIFGLHDVKMTQAEVQQKIDLKMPFTTSSSRWR